MDCSNPSISFNEILLALLRKDSTSGNALTGLGVQYFTSGYTQKGVNCNTQGFTFEQLFRLCLGVDPVCGTLVIRIFKITSPGCISAVDCGNAAAIDPLSEIFVYNPTDKTYAIALAEGL